jgi:hypothetical protein
MKRRLIDTAFDLYNPERKFLLMAEGDEEGQEASGGGEGAEGGEEAAQDAAQGEQDGAEGASEGEGQQEPADDWRAAIKDPDARKLAESSTDIDHLAKRALDMRKKLSAAIVKPGEDAPPEDVAAYRKALGIPEEASAYEFPDLPEGMEMTEAVEQSRAVWAERFHNLEISATAAKELARMVNEDALAAMKAEIEADEKNAEEAEAALRAEWKGDDYDRNVEYKKRAVAEMFGEDLEAVRQLQLKNGRFALDDPRILKAFAKVGREMDEGSLGDVMTDADRDRTQTELAGITEGIEKAQAKGDRDEANRLYQKQMALIAKMNGSQPVVGAQGRAA